MTGQNSPRPGSQPDEQLAKLLHDTVDAIVPQHGLDAIRSRTSHPSKESTMSVARTWLLGGLGGAVATATVIGGVWFASSNLGNDDPNPGPVGTPTASVDPTDSGSPSPSDSASPSKTPDSTAGPKRAVPVYYAGETPSGLRLYREFHSLPGVSGGSEGDVTGADSAAKAAVSHTPLDPDYRSLWPEGTEADVSDAGDQLIVNLVAPGGGATLHDRPSSMTAEEAQLAIEQVIYSVQAAFGKGRVPVQFLLDEKHSDQVLGQPASEPLAAGPVLETLSHVNLTSPAEGDEITGDSLAVSGVANSFEANVVIRLQRYEGTAIAFQKPLTAEGWMGEKLFPFSGSFDISDVAPGKYTLHAMTDDPSGGTEGPGAFSDTKVITIK
ncbi:Gmad2 immunoglobulin-like domain-containing protein [Nocardioides cavernaquae]|uniref:Bacterial spore germination immunoglobulin-like domain-containing protein n=1 Tax=Nocardioides cavernaquae TaxID=2321396 RepID=A0A3A5HDN8_9ACTN|nr:Gmad2 immunoglobulin-like domain-containing protein [Nocardioides cavernaquae]RJS47625.1 hypothetical protein D4739_16350 [Nocardioides cavernaquae]